MSMGSRSWKGISISASAVSRAPRTEGLLVERPAARADGGVQRSELVFQGPVLFHEGTDLEHVVMHGADGGFHVAGRAGVPAAADLQRLRGGGEAGGGHLFRELQDTHAVAG